MVAVSVSGIDEVTRLRRNYVWNECYSNHVIPFLPFIISSIGQAPKNHYSCIIAQGEGKTHSHSKSVVSTLSYVNRTELSTIKDSESFKLTLCSCRSLSLEKVTTVRWRDNLYRAWFTARLHTHLGRNYFVNRLLFLLIPTRNLISSYSGKKMSMVIDFLQFFAIIFTFYAARSIKIIFSAKLVL